MQGDDRITLIRLLRVVRDFRSSNLADDLVDLRKLQDGPVDLLFHFDRFGQRYARQADGLRRDRPFVHDRDKFGSQEGHEHDRATEQGRRCAQYRSSTSERPTQHRFICL